MQDEDLDSELLEISTPEERKARFDSAIAELNETPKGLAFHFKSLGDHRPVRTIERALQRVVSEETKVPGELAVIMNLLLRCYRRAKEDAASIRWEHVGSKSNLFTQGWLAEHRGFDINLTPQTRGRWHIHIRRKVGGFCPPWPTYQPSLEAAKIKALVYIDQVVNEDGYAETLQHIRHRASS